MKVLDLFSGIGGFSLGLEWAGMETIAMCEKDKFCRQVLAKHWPDITIHEDIRDLDGKDYKGSIDVVCGGFPCQPFSVAGKQLGKADDRHLWPEMLRVIKESAPTWVIGENVSGFVRMALDDVCSDLEGEGYRVQSFVIPACAVEAHHRRDRCWVVAYSDENDRRRRDSTISQERHTWMEHRSGGQGQPLGGSDSDVAHTNGARGEVGISGQESWQERHAGESHHQGDQQLRRSPRGEWPIEPRVGRVVDGVPNRVDRIRSLGNAVVPQVVEQIGLHIANFHNREET